MNLVGAAMIIQTIYNIREDTKINTSSIRALITDINSIAVLKA